MMATRLGCDYSYAPPTVAELVTAGVTFCCRYLSLPWSQKNLTRAEAERLSAAGIDLVVVWQSTKSFMLGGQAAGVADARSALDQATECGMSPGRPIYFALDIDPRPLTPAQWAQIRGYLDGAASVLGRAAVGVYGGLAAVNLLVGAGTARWGWQTAAWSGGAWSPLAQIQQYAHNQPLGSGLVDWNRAVVDDFGQWNLTAAQGGGMTRAPFAIWKPLPEATSQAVMDEVRGLIYHTPVGTMRGTWDYFARTSNPIESTWLMGCPLCGADLDGVIWQIMDADRRADANREANRFFGSIEMCDHGDPSRPLSPRQLAAAVRLGLWYRSRYGIPPRICPTPYSPGFGYHALWLDTSYEYADGSTPWTPSPGKVCPGPVRIRQLKTVVFPAIFAGTELEQEDDMFTDDDRIKLDKIERRTSELVVFGTTSVDATIESLFGHLRRIEANSKVALDKDAAILGALALLPTSGMTDEQLSQLAERLATRLPFTPDTILDALTTRLAS